MPSQRLVYTALSRHAFYAKELVCAHAFRQGVVPLNPFCMFGYFLYDLVDRDLVRAANMRIIETVDEIWQYGAVSDGCLAEIRQALILGKPLRFFSVGKTVETIRELSVDEIEFEAVSIREIFTSEIQPKLVR